MRCPVSIRYLLPASLALLCCGCLFKHHGTNVIRQQEARREVQFESLGAQQAFAAKAFSDKSREAGTKTKVVAIPLLLWWSELDVLSENAYYNDQAAACDANGDGQISVAEAVSFRPPPTPEALAATSSARNGQVQVAAGSEPEPEEAATPPVQPASYETPAEGP